MFRPLPPSRFRRVSKWMAVVVCLMFSLLWIISLRWAIGFPVGEDRTLAVSAGEVAYGWHWPFERFQAYASAYNSGSINRGGWGFRWPYVGGMSGLGDFSASSVYIPCWLILITAVGSTSVLFWIDGRTVRPGHCLTCGYDLRASKKTCPECGTAIRDQAQHD